MTSEEFDREVGKCRERLLATAVSEIGNLHDAEDMVQNALIETWLYPTDVGVRNFGGLAYRNLCRVIGRWRKKKRMECLPLDDEWAMSVEDDAPSPEQVALAPSSRGERCRDLVRLLDRSKLTPLQWRVLWACGYMGMSRTELAAEDGITPPAVFGAFNRAVDNVRREAMQNGR